MNTGDLSFVLSLQTKQAAILHMEALPPSMYGYQLCPERTCTCLHLRRNRPRWMGRSSWSPVTVSYGITTAQGDQRHCHSRQGRAQPSSIITSEEHYIQVERVMVSR